jgi:hypothetical protein
MSKQAQAERERKARVILGTAETEIAEKFAKASLQYADNPIKKIRVFPGFFLCSPTAHKLGGVRK